MILHIVNSTYGRPSNIAFRTAQINAALKRRRQAYQVFCRKSELDDPSVHAITPGGDILPRGLNALRMYALRNLPSRLYDNRFFGWLAISAIKRMDPSKVSLVHLWDPIPSVIEYFQAHRVPVIMELAIAPAFYGRSLFEKGIRTGDRMPHPGIEDAENRCFAMANHLLVPSPFIRDLLVEKGVAPSKISVRPFGVEPTSENITYPASGPLRFGFAGTVDRRKGCAYLLEAWDDPRFAGDELHLCGRVAPEFSALLKKPAFRNVRTPGFVKTREYLRDLHVYVLPSLMEGSSKSVYEAMSLGMPVITTPAAGSVATDGVEGRLIPIADANSLREAMLTFKNRPELIKQWGQAAKSKADQYPWSQYGDSIANFYSKWI